MGNLGLPKIREWHHHLIGFSLVFVEYKPSAVYVTITTIDSELKLLVGFHYIATMIITTIIVRLLLASIALATNNYHN